MKHRTVPKLDLQKVHEELVTSLKGTQNIASLERHLGNINTMKLKLDVLNNDVCNCSMSFKNLSLPKHHNHNEV